MQIPEVHLASSFSDLGDVQPYVALGKCLKENGHRVRIGTHPTFDSFVRDAGLEFYSIGGDPQEVVLFLSVPIAYGLMTSWVLPLAYELYGSKCGLLFLY